MLCWECFAMAKQVIQRNKWTVSFVLHFRVMFREIKQDRKESGKVGGEERHSQCRTVSKQLVNIDSVQTLTRSFWLSSSEQKSSSLWERHKCCETSKGWLFVWWFGLLWGFFFHSYTLYGTGILCLSVYFTKPVRIVSLHMWVALCTSLS